MKTSLAALLVLVVSLGALPPAARAQAPGCRAFPETGYTVCDDGQARFLAAFDRWGLQNIGYPISNRYVRDGFVTQAFQKAIMQWRAESGSVALVNIFDDLHNAGYDQCLLETRQTPPQMPGDAPGTPFDQVVRSRQALLETRPALRQAYFAAADPLTFFGLPTSAVTDVGNHYAVRLQRAVLQEWKEDVPWARAGQVTIANGGDIAKELGALPAEALVPGAPAPAPTTPPAPPAPAGVHVLGNTSHYVDSIGALHVVGEVQNNTGTPVQFVRIDANFFNSAGQLLATDFTYTTLDTVVPGDKACFDLLLLEEPAGWATVQFEPVQYRSDSPPPGGLVIFNDSGRVDSLGWYEIIGQVRNDSIAVHRYVQVVATLYNAGGSVVDCDFTYVNSTDLQPGQSSAFELNVIGVDAGAIATYRLQVESQH